MTIADSHPWDGDERPELDENLLAAYAEGRLSGERRALVEARLANDPDARALVAALAGDAEVAAAAEAARPARPLLARPWTLGAAAVVLLGVGFAIWSARPGEEETLEQAAARLAAEQPDLLRGFRPLDEAELAALRLPALRGGVVVHRPRGTSIEDRPRIEWEHVPGAASYRVAVYGADGRTLWARTTDRQSMPWPDELPALEGVAHTVEVVADAALGRAEGRASFRVARPAERRRWDEVSSYVRLRAPRHADALLAHLALRDGLLLEAERAAVAHAVAHPRDAGARALLADVRRALGIDAGD
jgi:hypothetical protein